MREETLAKAASLLEYAEAAISFTLFTIVMAVVVIPRNWIVLSKIYACLVAVFTLGVWAVAAGRLLWCMRRAGVVLALSRSVTVLVFFLLTRAAPPFVFTDVLLGVLAAALSLWVWRSLR